MASMDTTPASDDNRKATPSSRDDAPHGVDTLAALDPAEAPAAAEALAAELANDLEAVTTEPAAPSERDHTDGEEPS